MQWQRSVQEACEAPARLLPGLNRTASPSLPLVYRFTRKQTKVDMEREPVVEGEKADLLWNQRIPPDSSRHTREEGWTPQKGHVPCWLAFCVLISSVLGGWIFYPLGGFGEIPVDTPDRIRRGWPAYVCPYYSIDSLRSSSLSITVDNSLGKEFHFINSVFVSGSVYGSLYN